MSLYLIISDLGLDGLIVLIAIYSPRNIRNGQRKDTFHQRTQKHTNPTQDSTEETDSPC